MPPDPNPPVDVPRLLTHPVVVGAIALWAVNDHVLKAAWGNAVTGKLSDVAGLVATPAIAAGLLGALRLRPRRRSVDVAAALTAALLVAINLWEPAAEAYRRGFGLVFAGLAQGLQLLGQPLRVGDGVLTMDPSDVATLPAALVAPWLVRRQGSRDVARELGEGDANDGAPLPQVALGAQEAGAPDDASPWQP